MAAATVERDQPATPSELSPVVRALLARAADARAYARWQAQVAQTGYCSHPVRLAGAVEAVDPATGELHATYSTDGEPNGTLLVACGNRRASRCPSCSEVYRRDAFHLVRAGLAGGKGLPETVVSHPRVFATFTAPSFGQVRTRRARGGTVYPCHPARLGERCPHGRRRACWHKHDEGDARLGEPICPGCYDTQAQALWNALAPELWRRTTIALRRVLARGLGLTSEEFARRVRVAYVKVAEYQARGAVHFHAVFRLDGRDPTDPTAVQQPPEGASVDLLERAIREAGERARVLAPPFADVPARAARWGPQLDLRVIRQAGEDSEELSAERVAGYIAKYATKGTEGYGVALDRRIHHRAQIERLEVPEHIRELVTACWELGGRSCAGCGCGSGRTCSASVATSPPRAAATRPPSGTCAAPESSTRRAAATARPLGWTSGAGCSRPLTRFSSRAGSSWAGATARRRTRSLPHPLPRGRASNARPPARSWPRCAGEQAGPVDDEQGAEQAG